MILPGSRTAGLSAAAAAGAALALAIAVERFGGLVPCPLCLLERWPYRVIIVLGLIAAAVPRRAGRWLLRLALVATVAAAALAVTHVGVEQHAWPSPLPECAAPNLSGLGIAERLAAMPMRPSKPCEDATYLVPALPLSMAAMNLIYALGFSALLAIYLWHTREDSA